MTDNTLRPKKILLIQLRYIGDSVLTTPLINALKKGVPDAQIDVLAASSSAPVLIDHPHIHRLWQLDTRSAIIKFLQVLQHAVLLNRSQYDVVADLTYNDRSALLTAATQAKIRIGFCDQYPLRESMAYSHVIPSVLGYGHAADHYLRVAEVLKIPQADSHPWLHVPLERVHQLEERLAAEGGGNPAGPYVILHPGARRWYKSWPAERFAALGDRIYQRFHLPVVISGGNEDLQASAEITRLMREPAVDLTARIDLALLPALIQKAVCLVGNDSSPIHIATAVKTPAVALFGPTKSHVWGPRRKQDRVLAVELACCPCGHGQIDCPFGGNYCMSKISFASVWETVQQVIRDASAAG
jgi:predicted lipopolysaccharide heptosyltransferase III